MSSKDDDPDCDPLFAAIGRFSAAWGHAEFGLDGILRTIHEGRVLPRPDADFPISFKNKVRYFRAAIKEGVGPSTQGWISRVCEGLMNRSVMRGRIVHGFLVEIDPGGAGNFIRAFQRHRYYRLPSTSRYTTKQIMTETIDVRQLAGKLIKLSGELRALR